MFIERVINDERFKYLKKVIIKMYKICYYGRYPLVWGLRIRGFESRDLVVRKSNACMPARLPVHRAYRLMANCLKN